MNPAVSFLTNERLGGTFYPEGYDNMTTKERLKTVVSYVETSPKNLDLLDYQVSQSAAMRGGSESKVRFYEDVKNYIDAKRKGEEKDFIENKQVLPEIFDVDATRKENIEEFNKRFNNVTNSKSSNKNKNNINIIQSGTSNNQNAGGGSKDTKISSTPPDSGMINLPFYSPLDSDLAMERGAAKNLYNVYMG